MTTISYLFDFNFKPLILVYYTFFFIYIYLKQIEIISNLYNIEKNEYNIIVVIN